MIAAENKLLEYRILTKDSVITGPSIKRCAEKLSSLKDADKSTDASTEEFIRELLLFKLEMERSYMTINVFEKQNSEYASLESKIVQDIANARSNVLLLEEQLKQQKIIRKYRQECENSAKLVNTYPSRKVLSRKINLLEESLNNTNEEMAAIEGEILKKKKLFDVLMQTIEIDIQTITQDSDKNLQIVPDEVMEDEDTRDYDRNNREEEVAPTSTIDNADEGDGDGYDDNNGSINNSNNENTDVANDGEEMKY